MSVDVRLGDCRAVMAAMAPNSVDAIVTDPPYFLGFMNKGWDKDDPSALDCDGLPGTRGHGRKPGESAAIARKNCMAGQAFHESWAREAYRVLKPGGHLLAFGGTRTFHRLACALEDAGFEIRDVLSWLYGSGFPKSLDVSKALDKRGGRPDLATPIGAAIKEARERRGLSASECDRLFCDGTTNWSWFEGRPAGQRPPTPETFARIVAEWPELAPLAESVAEAERATVGRSAHRSGIGNGATGHYTVGGTRAEHYDVTAPATDLAAQWAGWGTSLKPAYEPILLCRKPLIGTVAANVAAHSTGGLNIDATRIGTQDELHSPGPNGGRGGPAWRAAEGRMDSMTAAFTQSPLGRWPANTILGCCGHDPHDPDCAVRLLDEQSGERGNNGRPNRAIGAKVNRAGPVQFGGIDAMSRTYGDTGGASRFFLNVPADEAERGRRPGGFGNVGASKGDSRPNGPTYGDSGGPSRFFYCAKSSRAERNAGLDGMPERVVSVWGGDEDDLSEGKKATRPTANHHPTVKPIALMRWLCRLICPPNGTILDPFTGSGTTGCAAALEGFAFIGIEQDDSYLEIATRRIAYWAAQAEAASTAEDNATRQLSMVAD